MECLIFEYITCTCHKFKWYKTVYNEKEDSFLSLSPSHWFLWILLKPYYMSMGEYMYKYIYFFKLKGLHTIHTVLYLAFSPLTMSLLDPITPAHKELSHTFRQSFHSCVICCRAMPLMNLVILIIYYYKQLNELVCIIFAYVRYFLF